MTVETYDIQELVHASGVARRTIYFYVQQGLLPPPTGAGLAAHYSAEHLLRLKLIPVLREQGLRLDEIRERFGRMSAEEMRAALTTADSQARIRPVPAPPLPAPGPGLPPPVIREPGSWPEQSYRHYHLPGGIQLLAPDHLNPLDRQRLDLLLQAARQIFSGVMPFIHHMDTQPDDNHEGGKPNA